MLFMPDGDELHVELLLFYSPSPPYDFFEVLAKVELMT